MLSDLLLRGKMRAFWDLVREFVELWGSYRPGHPGIKLFGQRARGGGPGTKQGQLRGLVAQSGEPYSRLLCLSSVKVPLLGLKLLRARGARVVVNQNGVFYPAWFGGDYGRENAYLRELNALADHSFFQSHFALESYRQWVGEPPLHSVVLHNGVDLDRFQPEQRPGEGKRVLVFLDWRPFNAKLWAYLYAFFGDPERTKRLSGLELVFVGAAAEDLSGHEREWECLRKAFSVEVHTSPSPDGLPGLLRSCDLALHLVYNDVCPNKVLECMASGVPVIVGSAGGAKELVGQSGAILPVPEGYGEHHYPALGDLEAAITGLLRAGKQARAASRAEAEKHGIVDWWQKHKILEI